MKKRSLCLTLVLVMIFSLLPMSASAATTSSYQPYAKIEYGYSTGVTCGTIRYMSQIEGSSYFNSQYWGDWITKRIAGVYSGPGYECGTCSMSMALSYIGVNVTPKQVLDKGNGVTCWDCWDATYKTTNISTGMSNYINGNGKYSPLVIKLPGGGSGSNDHFVVVIGMSGSTLQILDPAHNDLATATFSGSNVTYRGKTYSVSQVMQWYNANASKPSTSYIDKCTAYASYCTVKTTAKTTLKSYPCSASTDSKSTDIKTLESGTSLTATALYKNTAGNYWYKVTYDGKTCYLYSGDTSFVKQLSSDVKISGEVSPSSITKGKTFSIGGTISTTYNKLVQVGGFIFKSGVEKKAANKEYGDFSSASNNTYSLSKSYIDNILLFNNLPVGTYCYMVQTQLMTYYSTDGKTLSNCSSWPNVVDKTFQVVEAGHTHSYGTAWKSDSTNHWHVCSCGATSGKAAHTYGSWTTTKAATCTDSGTQTRTCTACGYKQTQSIAATGHNYGSWTTTEAATCTESGEQTRTCANCGNKQIQSIAATGHDYGGWETTEEATCNSSGTETRTCIICGDKQFQYTEPNGQHYCLGWKTTKAATCTDSGIQKRVCEYCNTLLEEREIPPIHEEGHEIVNGKCIYCDLDHTCGENTWWDLSTDGTLTFYGNGDIDFDTFSRGFDHNKLSKEVKTVVIEGNITENYDFKTMFDIIEFDNLTKFVVSEDNKYYSSSNGVLYNKDRTSLIKVPNGKTGDYTIPGSVTSIDPAAFRDNSLSNIYVSNDNACFTSKNGVLFDKEMKTLLRYPGGRQGEYVIPNGVKISNYAFCAVKGLTGVVIPDGITRIPYAFQACVNLKSVTIPASVTCIDNGAFNYCLELKDVYYGGTEEQWKAVFIEDGNDGIYQATIHYKENNLAISKQPSNLKAASGTTGKFSVTATGEDLTYQWQYLKPNGSWTNCVAASGKTATLSVNVRDELNGYKYRCKITDANGNSVTSSTATLTVTSALEITRQPSNLTAQSGTTGKFTVNASGDGLKYQWQYLKPNGSWTNCTAASGKTATLSVNVREAINGYKYRCKITDASGNSVTSSTATLTVTPAITKQPTSIKAQNGTTGKLTITAAGDGLSYQWQYQKPGTTTWTNCTAASGKTATLSVNAREAIDGYKYRCVVENSCGNSITSSVATLTVVYDLAITKQPTNLTAASGTTGKLKVTAVGTGLSYQWQYLKPGTTTWTNCTAASGKTATLSINCRDAINGYKYRCIVKDTLGDKVTSNTVTLKVS